MTPRGAGRLAPLDDDAAALGRVDLALDLAPPPAPASGPPEPPDLAALEDLADRADAAARAAGAGYRVDVSTPQGQAFSDDMARMFRNLGVVSFRAVVVDIDSLVFHSSWAIHSTGALHDSAFEASLEGAFPNAAGTMAQLSAVPIASTLVQRMSPRRWVFAWRIDERRAVMAMAHFLEGRMAMAAVDTAVVRLVCDAGIQADLALPQRSAAEPAASGPVWPQVERRRRVVPRWIRLPALLLVCLCTLLAGWLTLVSLPQTRHDAAQRDTELDRLQTMADRTMVRSVAAALGSGDYGEVQLALSGFAALGYFDQAVVTNTDHRVVAFVGTVGGVRIGDAAPLDLLRRATHQPLMQGSAPNGQLLILRPPVASAQQRVIDRLMWPSVLALVTGACAALLMAARWPRRRAPRPRVPPRPN